MDYQYITAKKRNVRHKPDVLGDLLTFEPFTMPETLPTPSAFMQSDEHIKAACEKPQS